MFNERNQNSMRFSKKSNSFLLLLKSQRFRIRTFFFYVINQVVVMVEWNWYVTWKYTLFQVFAGNLRRKEMKLCAIVGEGLVCWMNEIKIWYFIKFKKYPLAEIM